MWEVAGSWPATGALSVLLHRVVDVPVHHLSENICPNDEADARLTVHEREDKLSHQVQSRGIRPISGQVVIVCVGGGALGEYPGREPELNTMAFKAATLPDL